jgi:hypothetical protein
MTTQIAEYNIYRDQIAEVIEASDFLPNVSDKDGYDKSKRVALDIGKILTALDKARKDKKAFALQLGRDIDGEAKVISEKLEALRQPHKLAYQGLDNEKKAREKARIDELLSRIDFMRGLPAMMIESDAAGLLSAAQDLLSDDCTDYYEKTMDALVVRNAAAEELDRMYHAAIQREKDALELARFREASTDVPETPAAPEVEPLKPEVSLAAIVTTAVEKSLKADANNAAMEAFIAGGLSNADAKKVVILIAKGLIPNVGIYY